MKKTFVQAAIAFVPAFLLFALASATPGAEIDCLKCHARLKAGKTVHAAVDMGCATCHGGIDAAKVPHKKTNTIAKGLNADQPDLCYGCHDKGVFTKKTVHAAVGMGCTGCHDPHSSKNAKLLKSEAPGLCFTCHDKKAFTGKTVHAPVAAGMCLTCHGPHSSDNYAILTAAPYDLCVQCHDKVPQGPHAVVGMTRGGHPLKPEKEIKVRVGKELVAKKVPVKDPSRPDKPFYCGSCHEPHAGSGYKLLRGNADSAMKICVRCHKY